jgi:N-carbamoyl-L-amino-acid hydrolase
MLPLAAMVMAARTAAERRGALATVGKVIAEPGAANAISSSVHAWLDARAPDIATLTQLVGEVWAAADSEATKHGVHATRQQESVTSAVSFDGRLRERISAVRAPYGTRPPVLATGAGHDAGALAGRVPAAMLFVRNPTGVSHAPGEHAEAADCEAGVAALAAVRADLAGR